MSLALCSTAVDADGPSRGSYIVEANSDERGSYNTTFVSDEHRVYCLYEHLGESSCRLQRRADDAVEVISIPNSVRELGPKCFGWCKSLRRVTFGAASKLERICPQAFRETSLDALSIPDSVVELGQACFGWCSSLRCLRFGAASKLERICAQALRHFV